MPTKQQRAGRVLATPKRILITGASRGIGRAAALALARAGHTPILCARDQAALSRVAEQIAHEGGRAELLALDLCDDASVARAMSELERRGGCDVLVNNAGSCEQVLYLSQSPAACRAELELNYWGPQRLVRALLPSWIRRGSGLIVNVSSLLGSIASPSTASYGASKAALESWSYALRAELAAFGIRVSVFVAPHTDTEMGRRVHFAGVHSLPVDYTAKELIRAIDCAPRRYAGSPVYRLLLWLARLFPVLMEAKVGATARPALTPAHAYAEPAQRAGGTTCAAPSDSRARA